ncbi:MAG: MBL fold metallo-hydrolase [Lentisphaerae bacterium]|nr:MBL fold metallo-hydrolase [Lentisphaerota bacterium]
MKMLFLGCGAADYNWKNYGEAGVLGSTATLLDDGILLDCGPTVTAAMARFGVEKEQIKAIVNTHNHSDHLNFEEVRKIACDRKIDFYGSAEACAGLAECCTVHPLTFGDEFTIGGKKFLALPSNHAVENLREETFNYLITGDKSLLYALDTAWMLTRARLLIGNSHIDAIVWDATMSEPDDWRIFEHSDPVMFASIRRVLKQTGNIDDDVKIWFDHRARTLWPADPAEQEAIARREGVMLAHDGESVVI